MVNCATRPGSAACRRLFLGLGLLILTAHSCPNAFGRQTVSFRSDIRPVLADKCLVCHGFDSSTREADLRLDTFEGATSDANGDPAIVPGDPDSSLLWQRINSDDESERMPPADSHKQLSADEIALLGQWIREGAHYESHWSFRPPQKPAVPPFPDGGQNEIDAFIADRLGKSGLKMSAEASRETLIRRVAFTLTGLPPSLADVDRFIADSEPGAYERMVDRYLESPHFGEEMARHWLDLARYGDTHGLHLDNERQMWAYRDWVVRAFNNNQPFDQFSIDQLAGDLFAEPTTDQLIATGFNRCNVTTSEGGAIDAEFLYRYAVDRTSTFAETWLGLTAGCAVCHDHKFDPLTSREFYSLYAFFNSAADPAMDGNALLTNPVLKLPDDSAKQALAELDAKISGLEKSIHEQATSLNWTDPAAIEPKPEPVASESIWMDDSFPEDRNGVTWVGHETEFVSAGPAPGIAFGNLALKRKDTGLAQDVWQLASHKLEIPPEATLFAYVYLEPSDVPQTIMLQYFREGWMHRALWGNYDTIPWGQPDSPEKFSMGSLPETGKWVRLEVPASSVGLKAGDAITGFATTQFGGTVYWDRVGVSGISDPANDPLRSFVAWWRTAKDRDLKDVPGDLHDIARKGPDANLDPELASRLKNFYLGYICADTRDAFASSVNELRSSREKRKAVDDATPRTFIFRDLDKPRESFVMIRGQYDKPGEPVQADVPAVLPGLAEPSPGTRRTRMDLAKWLFTPENPLVARVMVNRYWQQVMGTGLVKSSSDFGTQGELPSHPELLDWLAVRFRESGWNVKSLMRTLVLSATFRQESAVTPDLLELDPENRLYARGPRIRLDAEQIRDNALYVSGLIDLTAGGKGAKPYQPANIWEPVGYTDSNTRYYKQDNGSALYRRSLYTFIKRTAPPPFMVNFDAPNREQPCSRRERSNTPLQALQLLNDVQHVEAARTLAQRAIVQAGNSADDRIRFAFRTVLCRLPNEAELEILRQQWTRHLDRYRQTPADAEKLVRHGETAPDGNIDVAELAAMTLVASTVLNLDETITRN
jgi:Protein of unknown function (DUF1553)/Protein of unknown function (DUF1549)/Planctomycete cytochrome C